MSEQNNAVNSLAHTKWNCKYHIVFAPKYRRKVFFNEKREDMREILRTLCQWKGVEIIEGEICPDHVHLLLSIPPKMSVSGFVGYLKGKSSLMIFQKYGNMKFAYRNREFWCKGYYVDTVGKNTKAIKEYISEQLKRDQEADASCAFTVYFPTARFCKASICGEYITFSPFRQYSPAAIRKFFPILSGLIKSL